MSTTHAAILLMLMFAGSRQAIAEEVPVDWQLYTLIRGDGALCDGAAAELTLVPPGDLAVLNIKLDEFFEQDGKLLTKSARSLKTLQPGPYFIDLVIHGCVSRRITYRIETIVSARDLEKNVVIVTAQQHSGYFLVYFEVTTLLDGDGLFEVTLHGDERPEIRYSGTVSLIPCPTTFAGVRSEWQIEGEWGKYGAWRDVVWGEGDSVVAPGEKLPTKRGISYIHTWRSGRQPPVLVPTAKRMKIEFAPGAENSYRLDESRFLGGLVPSCDAYVFSVPLSEYDPVFRLPYNLMEQEPADPETKAGPDE